MTANDPQKQQTIAILGGGPAGAATALSLSQTLEKQPDTPPYQIHLIHSPRPSNIRIGETIPPTATQVLQRLGASDIVINNDRHLCCPGSVSHWNSDTPGFNDFFFDLEGDGYHLDRPLFDHQLLERASQCDIHVHANWHLKQLESQAEQHQLHFSTQEKEDQQLSADFVVDASGRGAAFARRLKVFRNSFDDVSFICLFVDLPNSHPLTNQTFVESVAEGWWYAARIPGNRMIITLCSDRQMIAEQQLDMPEAWLLHLSRTQLISKQVPGSLFSHPHPELDLIQQNAPSSLLSSVAGNNWLAVGDAASSCDPITSAGITKALLHGEQAGIAIANWLRHGSSALNQYRERVFNDFKQYVRVRHTLYSTETRFPDSPFWKRRMGL